MTTDYKALLSKFSGAISMNDLPVEKQFTHTMFCQKIANIDLETAKQLLAELHLLYLSQQVVFIKLAKQEFTGKNL